MKPKAICAAAVMVFALVFGTEAGAETAQAELRNAAGEVVGKVTLAEDGGKVSVSIEATGLPPGFHGFHIHAVGKCEPPDFTSAGAHFNPEGKDHGDHVGDLPNLLVMADGTGSMTLKTDRVTVVDLFDADGSALIIHADPDNHANIPDRYQPAPDKTTLATGDAGARIACGVITR